MSFSEWIILSVSGWTHTVLLFYTTYVNVDLPHHEIFRALVGKGGISNRHYTE